VISKLFSDYTYSIYILKSLKGEDASELTMFFCFFFGNHIFLSKFTAEKLVEDGACETMNDT